MDTIRDFYQENKRYLLASFLIPFFILAIMYLFLGIFFGSSRSILASDAFSQFSNFHASYRNAMLGKQSFLFTWNASLGLNYLALISYYLGGIFTPLVIFFPNEWMPDALYFLTLLKIGSAGLAFWFYAKHTFRLSEWGHVILSTCYALMSFAIAYSELIMWLDAFVYLPLIIWGINRIFEYKKPRLLFFSYFLLFSTSFYMGFMVGVFSFLYFLTQVINNWSQYKSRISTYLTTSFLAGGASMFIILPTIYDLRSNGEALNKVLNLKTEATSLFDFFIKNMIGVYDTTKYGTIPFIYVGLIPLIFFTYYFVTKKIPLKEKILSLTLFVILEASFYLVPLNLFWHGFHSPNMFIFRYAYLMSFLVAMLAGYGWEQFEQREEQTPKLLVVILILIALFSISFGMVDGEQYEYLKVTSYVITIVFLISYVLILAFYQLKLFTKKQVILTLLFFTVFELSLNTHQMLQGILEDWNYASRSLYTEPYPDINNLVKQTNDSKHLIRVENLDSVSSNDSLNYGYSGISLFSSIRNGNTAEYLDQLGFRSRGEHQNTRYENNTLLMDAFIGIKYNLSKQAFNKYGFKQTYQSGAFTLFENEQALTSAFLTDTNVLTKVTRTENDPLENQERLINGLLNQNESFYTFATPNVIETKNTSISTNGETTIYTEEAPNLAKEVTWEVVVPANTQAYLDLAPADFSEASGSTATILVEGTQRETSISNNGEFYDLGYYKNQTTLRFTASFYGTPKISFHTPKIAFLDIDTYQKAIDQLKLKGVNLTKGKRSLKGNIEVLTDQQIVTSIPYDKGWTAKVDGKVVQIDPLEGAFVTFKLPKGSHEVLLVYTPQGFKLGALLFFICMILFYFLNRHWRKQTINQS